MCINERMSDTGIESRMELGYLFLENTPVRILDIKSNFRLRPNVWYNLEFATEKEDNHHRKTPHYWDDSEDLCDRCELVLYPGAQEQTLRIPWGQILPFNRFTSSRAPAVAASTAEQPTECCYCHRKSKTDGALLFGLLKSIEADAEIVDGRLLFIDGSSFQNVAVYVTISFPHLRSSPKGAKRSLLGSRSAKSLSDEFQLLLSLIRSDWDELDLWMNNLERPSPRFHNRLCPSNKRTLFPPRLSMEELYHRIQSSAFDQEQSYSKLDSQILRQFAELTKLPKDILQRNLAPFLTAGDLDAIRTTCSYFHGLFESVVPGLSLRLYRHQISSLGWMRQRESRELLEEDCLGDDKNLLRAPDGDMHRAVTGGHTVKLASRKNRSILRFDTHTGREHEGGAHHSRVAARRRVCRGGLLVDEPGLGKTITVLSLVLQTAALSTRFVLQSVEKSEGQVDNQALFHLYWRESVPSSFRLRDLLKLLNAVGKKAPRGSFPVENIRRRIDTDAYAANFTLFEKELESEIRKCPDNDLVFSLICILRDVTSNYKSKMVASAKKSFSNALAKPYSSLAAYIEEAEGSRFINALVRSRGTLIVIPSVLMDHWESQIEEHVNTRYLSPKLPLLYTFGKDGGISLGTANELIESGRHEPLVFFDRNASKSLPPAEFLSKFLIVVTTTSRFSQEWKNGSFQEEVKKCHDSSAEQLYERGLDRSTSEACSLLKIHWFRMIIDEGHSMGRGALSSSIQFASWISSERRWAMTGTPTKEGSIALSQLRNLMHFLQHDFFTPRCEGETVWKKYISQPWKTAKSERIESHTGGLAAFFRLRSLLKLLMKRHTKEDIVELSPPIFKESLVTMSEVEVVTYNALVAAIQSNLLLTSMKEDAQQDSLLHRSQARHARQGLENVRSVCLGFSRVVPVLSEKHWQETVDLMQAYALSAEAQVRVKEFMMRAQLGGLTSCECCGLQLSILLVLPCCGALVCTECMDGQKSQEYANDGSEPWMHKPRCKKKKKNRKYFNKECVMCESYFDVDNLQLLQPGLVFSWQDNLKLDKEQQEDRGEVPDNGAAALVNADMHEEENPSNHRNEIIIRPPAARRRTKKPNDGHECEYDRYSIDGKCIHCLREHDYCNLLKSSRCNVCHRMARECPEEETKSSYLVKRFLSLMHAGSSATPIVRREAGPRPIKIIVFSQFRKALNLVGDRLLRRFGTACVSEYWGKYRTSELLKFTRDPECFCMLLGKDGSEGLDLSFVTHIFFLEEIWDKSLADQTVSRAWRMGARGPVEVETIIAKDSVEENMKAFEAGQLVDQSMEDSATCCFKQKDYVQQKTHALLKSLRLITDYHHLSNKPRGKEVKPEEKPTPLKRAWSEQYSLQRPVKRRKVTFADGR